MSKFGDSILLSLIQSSRVLRDDQRRALAEMLPTLSDERKERLRSLIESEALVFRNPDEKNIEELIEDADDDELIMLERFFDNAAKQLDASKKKSSKESDEAALEKISHALDA